MGHSAMGIANEFLRKQGKEHSLTHMQLQKLVYIAHGWNLAINGKPLTSNEIEAWDNGPVYPDMYQHLKRYGGRAISDLIHEGDDSAVFFRGSPRGHEYKANDLTLEEEAVINSVWENYGAHHAFRLSELTHSPGTPWSETYYNIGRSALIRDPLIERHFQDLASRARVRQPAQPAPARN